MEPLSKQLQLDYPYYIRRTDWPQAPYLEKWLDTKVNQQGIDVESSTLNAAIEACNNLLESGRQSCTEVRCCG